MRIVSRWFAFRAPYTWLQFSTRFHDRDGVVGEKFFQEFSRKMKGEFETRAKVGLVDSMSDLMYGGFDPAKLDPLIRDFYEKTYNFEMFVKVCWNRLVWPFGYLYRMLIADNAKQLLIPLDD